MILIETGKFKDFNEYLSYLGKPAKKNYAYAKKHNEGVIYEMIGNPTKNSVGLNLIQWWMDIWGRQLIRGQQREYAFRAVDLEGRNIFCFRATEKGVGIAMQFVEVIDGYMNCHPVMYEKEKYADRYLSKFMWFNLLSWAIDNKIDVVDLGGGNDESWREMIRNRDNYPNPAYKWMYVPQFVKLNPDKQQDYRVTHDGITKRISKIN